MPLSNTTMSQITTAEAFSAAVHNRPHSELQQILRDMNPHHNANLVHTGSFTVVGDFNVTGTVVSDSGGDLDISDKLVTLNYQGSSATMQDGGITVSDSAANDYWIKYDRAFTNKFKAKDIRPEGELVALEATGEILASNAINPTDAITWSQWQALGATSATPYPITETRQEVPLTSGNHYIDFIPYGFIEFYSTGEDLPIARAEHSMAGSQNSSLTVAGLNAEGSYNGVSFVYNGFTWSAGATISQGAKSLGTAVGCFNAALYFKGGTGVAGTGATEKFNGQSWSNVATPGGGNRYANAGFGIQNACISAGGAGGLSSVESFNGLVWVAVGVLSGSGRYYHSGVGTQNLGMIIAGVLNGLVDLTTEHYNGNTKTWSVGNSLPVGVLGMNACGGNSRRAVVHGGLTTSISHASVGYAYSQVGENDVWRIGKALNATRTYSAASGPAGASLVAGGCLSGVGSFLVSVEEWFSVEPKLRVWSDVKRKYSDVFPQLLYSDVGHQALFEVSIAGNPGTTIEDSVLISELQLEDIGGGSWGVGADMSYSRTLGFAAGTQQSAVVWGGQGLASAWRQTEVYSGTTWSAGGNQSLARWFHGGAGCRNAALSFGGQASGGGNTLTTEKYDGSVWSASVANLNAQRQGPACAGIQNAALAMTGDSGTWVSTSERFNGTAWTSITSPVSNAGTAMGTGIANAALMQSGNGPQGYTEKFNGLVWSLTAQGLTGRKYGGMSGLLNSAKSIAGYNGATVQATTEQFNGFFWIARASLNTAVQGNSAIGSNLALTLGGSTTTINGAPQVGTEKFNLTIVLSTSIGLVVIKKQ